MFRALMPRVGRHACSWLQHPVRGFSKRDLPVRFPWFRHRSPWDDFFNDTRALRAFDDHFKDMIDRMERMMSPRFFEGSYYPRARRFAADNARSEVAEVKYDKSNFEVRVDVQQFQPEELNVKLSNNYLIISGKHESKADEHGYVTREFTREVLVPEDVDLDSVTSRVTDDGFLVIEAKVKPTEKAQEKEIKIEREGKPKE